MLKKLLIVSLIGLTSSFVYAEEKKVTGEMLIGKWMCTVNKYLKKEYDYQGKVISEKEMDIRGVVEGPVIYKKNGDKIEEHVFDEYHDEENFDEAPSDVFFDDNEINQCEQKVATSDGDTSIRKAKRNYISDNEFQYIKEDSFIKANILIRESKTEMTCTRIK